MESGALRDTRRTVHFGLARQLDNAELIDHYPEPQGSRGGYVRGGVTIGSCPRSARSCAIRCLVEPAYPAGRLCHLRWITRLASITWRATIKAIIGSLRGAHVRSDAPVQWWDFIMENRCSVSDRAAS